MKSCCDNDFYLLTSYVACHTKLSKILLLGELLISCRNQLDQPKVILEQGSWYLFHILPSKCTPHKIRHCWTWVAASAHLCPLVPTWPEVCSADARTMPLPVRGFPTQQLSPCTAYSYTAEPTVFQRPQTYGKGISQNQHIGSQNTNLNNYRPFVCLYSISQCILTQKICTIDNLVNS